jgi:hypothetical protein
MEPLVWIRDADGKRRPDCRVCRGYLSRLAVDAAEAVAVEHGMGADQVLRMVTDRYHANGHRETHGRETVGP